ncbi:hypothetical protein GCM10028818_40860 [Spirosoma horti]
MLVGLTCLTSLAQTTSKTGTVYETIRSVFPGNPDAFTVTFDSSDSLKTVSVNTYYVTGGIAPSYAQPTVTRTGLSVSINFPNVSLIPSQARVKLKIGDAVKQVWRYDVSETNTIKTNPSSLTITNYVVGGADSFSDLKNVPPYLSQANIQAKAPQSAIDAINDNLIKKKSWVPVADRTALLQVSPIPNTLLEVVVSSDSKYGNGLTIYNIMPNGDRYLVSFLTVKDN